MNDCQSSIISRFISRYEEITHLLKYSTVVSLPNDQITIIFNSLCKKHTGMKILVHDKNKYVVIQVSQERFYKYNFKF